MALKNTYIDQSLATRQEQVRRERRSRLMYHNLEVWVPAGRYIGLSHDQ